MNLNHEKLKKPSLIPNISGSTSWEEWLSETEIKLKELGYKRFVQNHKNEDFSYWKTLKKGEDKIYQVGILFYDYRRYAHINLSANEIAIMYQCMLLSENRIDMCVSKNIDLKEFENMAKAFYEAMIEYCR